MLRDFYLTIDKQLICEALGAFKIDIEPSQIHLIEFRVISPDCFIWRLLISKTVYYMYAEDFVQGLLDPMANVSDFMPGALNLKYIPVKVVKPFNEAEPVKATAVYREPAKVEQFMQFASDSGYDFVFLLESAEKGEDALFAD